MDRTLDYKINLQTPYIFLGILIEALADKVEKVDPKVFHLIGVRILEGFYYSRTEIFSKLFKHIMGHSRDNDR